MYNVYTSIRVYNPCRCTGVLVGVGAIGAGRAAALLVAGSSQGTGRQ